MATSTSGPKLVAGRAGVNLRAMQSCHTISCMGPAGRRPAIDSRWRARPVGEFFLRCALKSADQRSALPRSGAMSFEGFLQALDARIDGRIGRGAFLDLEEDLFGFSRVAA